MMRKKKRSKNMQRIQRVDNPQLAQIQSVAAISMENEPGSQFQSEHLAVCAAEAVIKDNVNVSMPGFNAVNDNLLEGIGDEDVLQNNNDEGHRGEGHEDEEEEDCLYDAQTAISSTDNAVTTTGGSAGYGDV